MDGAIGGVVEPGFEAVRDEFTRNFTEHGDVGASVCVYVDGRPVVDLWGGVRDREGTPYGPDTLQLVFSTTKGVTAAAANLLIQRGELDADAPVAEYWPEFAQAGKQDIPVRWLLCHKAGLPVIDEQLSFDEAIVWDRVTDALARQAPIWEPGTAHGYHALTYGWLVGEVIRRVSGKDLGTFVADELATPLGLDLWIGLPAAEEARVAPLMGGLVDNEAAEADPAVRAMVEQFMGPDTILGRALSLSGAFAASDAFNRPELHAAQLGAANCITNARSLSRLYAGLIGTVEGGPATALLEPAQIEAARTTQTEGADRCLVFPTTFGLGFMTSGTFAPFGGAGAFGHPGAGGSVAFADPDHGISFGYAMNRMKSNLSGDPRTRGLIEATYAAAGAPVTFV